MGSLLLFHNAAGTLLDVHFFGGTLVEKLLGACKYASLLRKQHASDERQ